MRLPQLPDDDGLGVARGMMWALVLSLPLWAAMGVIGYLIWHR